MSRTYVHTPANVKFSPDAIWWGPRRNVTFSEWIADDNAGLPRESYKNMGRPKAVKQAARQANRKARHTARAAIRAEKFDALPDKYSARHGAAWDCM